LKKYLTILIVTGFCACSQAHKGSKRTLLEAQAFYDYDHDKYALAKFYLDTLINLDSTKGEYYFKRAYSREKLSDSLAIDDYQKAITLNYGVARAYKNMAIDMMQVENDSLALILFNKAFKADPSMSSGLAPLIKACKDQIEWHKTDAWKDFEEWKTRVDSSSTPINR
jgi:tetratricopeptide (TPR) repeat protein